MRIAEKHKLNRAAGSQRKTYKALLYSVIQEVFLEGSDMKLLWLMSEIGLLVK